MCNTCDRFFDLHGYDIADCPAGLLAEQEAMYEEWDAEEKIWEAALGPYIGIRGHDYGDGKGYVAIESGVIPF
jgi:hypothetical protein